MNSRRLNPFINRKPLEGGGREVFMKRVRESLGGGTGANAAVPEPPVIDEALVRQCADSGAALIERWMAKAKGNSIAVHRCTGETAAIHAAMEACLSPHATTKILLNAGEIGQRFAIAEFVAERSAETVRWGEPGCREAAFSCDAAITDCRAGLADAGSVVVWSDTGFGRSSTLVIPVHVILLPVSLILPDLVDGLRFIARENAVHGGGAGLPSNVVIINGPSKTADIEMNLITGVHGPKHVYVILIDGV